MFFERPLMIEFAKNRSEIVAREEGTWTPKDKHSK